MFLSKGLTIFVLVLTFSWVSGGILDWFVNTDLEDDNDIEEIDHVRVKRGADKGVCDFNDVLKASTCCNLPFIPIEELQSCREDFKRHAIGRRKGKSKKGKGKKKGQKKNNDSKEETKRVPIANPAILCTIYCTVKNKSLTNEDGDLDISKYVSYLTSGQSSEMTSKISTAANTCNQTFSKTIENEKDKPCRTSAGLIIACIEKEVVSGCSTTPEGCSSAIDNLKTCTLVKAKGRKRSGGLKRVVKTTISQEK